MIKPILLAVDDDPQVLRAIERDLREQYAARYRIMRADSGDRALGLLRELRKREDPVALLLVDQRMPHMSGVEFLAQAIDLYPDAKRVLLTAYADTEAAIQAINEAKLHHYLMKPWDPPEENLYPVISELLDDWVASFHPPFQGVRILGNRWSPQTHELKDFLARNHVPYQWLDVESADRDPKVMQLLQSVGNDAQRLPLMIFQDGSTLSQPAPSAIADELGLRTRPEQKFYDLIIVGGGPAGLAAAVYGASEGLRTVMVEREAPGGQAGLSSRIENYLGFPAGVSGADLARRAVAQARRFQVEILAPQEAVGLRADGPAHVLKLGDGSEISGHALLVATGVQWRSLNVPGIDRLQGAGVYYGGAMTEALLCQGEDVYVVGGANSAGQAAMYFSKYARRVIMLVRGASLASTMSQYLIDQIANTSNIQVELNSSVSEVHGSERLEEVSIHCSASGETARVPANSLYIFIGAVPKTDWLDGIVARDELGFILSGQDLVKNAKRPSGWTVDRDPELMETSVPGIFVVGDVRHGSVKRVASGVGEGAIAVQLIHQYLATK